MEWKITYIHTQGKKTLLRVLGQNIFIYGYTYIFLILGLNVYNLVTFLVGLMNKKDLLTTISVQSVQENF